MAWLRKSLLHLLTLVLFASLLGVAYSTSARLSFGRPDNIKNWLAQSNFYGHFVDNAIDQAQETADSNPGVASLSFNDPGIRQTARTALSQAQVQQAVSIFVDSNYAWLEGKTNKPSFTIDFTQAKQSFAAQVGQQVETRLANLPVCSITQLVQIQNAQSINPLSINCRPPGVSPQLEAAQVSQQITNSSGFLSNPVITADTLNPSQSSASPSQPYYTKLSQAPRLYRLSLQLPWVFLALVLLTSLGVLLLAPRRKAGLRRISIVLLVSGLILLLAKYVSDILFTRLQSRVLNSANTGSLQSALTDFAHRAEIHMLKLDSYFALACIALAAVLALILLLTRQPTKVPPRANREVPSENPDSVPPTSGNVNAVNARPSSSQAKRPPLIQ